MRYRYSNVKLPGKLDFLIQQVFFHTNTIAEGEHQCHWWYQVLENAAWWPDGKSVCNKEKLMQRHLIFFCKLGFALHLPAHSPQHCKHLLRVKHSNSCLRSTWVKHAEFFWLAHGRFSFQYFPVSHSGWTQTVVDTPVPHSGLLSLPSCMPGTTVTLAGLQFWLQHPAPSQEGAKFAWTGLWTKHYKW